LEIVMLNIGRVRPPMPVSSVMMVGAISSTVYCSIAWRGRLCTCSLAWRTERRMACRRSPASAMSVPSVAMMKVMALPCPRRRRAAPTPGMPVVSVCLRQAVALQQEAPQRAAAHRQHHVVERAVGRGGQRAQALHGELLGGEAALLAHAAVEHRRGASNGSTMPSPVAEALEHLAEGDGQLRQRARLPRRPSTAASAALAMAARGPAPCRLAPPAPATGPERRQLQALSVGRHGALQQLHAADAVDQRVVHLDEQREAVPLQPLDDGAFPGRAHQVQRRALQAPDQFAQLALAARPGQRGVAHVVFEVDRRRPRSRPAAGSC
jgi:hypothetical protein